MSELSKEYLDWLQGHIDEQLGPRKFRSVSRASGIEARQGGDGETRLHRNDDSPTEGDAQNQSGNPQS